MDYSAEKEIIQAILNLVNQGHTVRFEQDWGGNTITLVDNRGLSFAQTKEIPPDGECDNCGEGFDTMGEAWTISEQVKQLLEAGWKGNRKHILCPECDKKGYTRQSDRQKED